MDHGILIATNGTQQVMLAIQANNNNLANVNTVGFRASLNQFVTVDEESEGYDTRAYAQADKSAWDYTPGTIIHTGRDLDVAIEDHGWLCVQNDEEKEAYSRAGNLQLSQEGLLQSASGRPILGNKGPINIPPAEKINIAKDGTISIRPAGAQAETMVVVDRLKLVNPDKKLLARTEDGLFKRTDDEPSDPDETVSLAPESLESSNVNPINTMVEMIQLSRDYEMQIKIMKAMQDNDQSSEQIMQESQ